jgi:signal transduction histidine kinase
VDVAELVAQIAQEIAASVQGAGAVIDVAPDMPAVKIDRTRLWQVFENLLTNALKYGCPAPGMRIEIGAQVAEGEVRFSVRDHGPGIDAAYHRRVFEMFQRLHHDDRGTGIGLAIVEKIAKVHGGRVWVQSSPGQGATFWFALPDTLIVPGRVAPCPEPKGTSAWTVPSDSSSSRTMTATP